MYERFTDRARRVMLLANQEAQRFEHEYIGTEHILLGLIRDGRGVAANVLHCLDINLNKVRAQVELIIQFRTSSDSESDRRLPMTPRAKKVVEYAIEEAHVLKHNYVGTEHLLLGLMREEEGVAAQVLTNLGVTTKAVRNEMSSLLGYNLPDSELPLPPKAPEPHDFAIPPNLPADLRKAVEEMAVLSRLIVAEKEAAVAEQDFERAIRFRDWAITLKSAITIILAQWSRLNPDDPSTS